MVSVDGKHRVYLLIETELFFYPGVGTRLMFTCMLGRHVTSTVLLVPKTVQKNHCQYPDLSAGADSVAGQLRGDDLKSAPSVA